MYVSRQVESRQRQQLQVFRPAVESHGVDVCVPFEVRRAVQVSRRVQSHLFLRVVLWDGKNRKLVKETESYLNLLKCIVYYYDLLFIITSYCLLLRLIVYYYDLLFIITTYCLLLRVIITYC